MKNNLAQQYALSLKEASAEAVRLSGAHSYHLNAAGKIVELRFAGDSLIEAIIPAFSHLLIEQPSHTDVRITLWDSESTGVQRPKLPWSPPQGEAWKLFEGEQRAFYLPYRGSLIWFNEQVNEAYYWNQAVHTVYEEESFSPLLNFWAWFMGNAGVQLTHAAAVSGRTGAALLVGAGGSGKSTTSLLTLGGEAGSHKPLQFISDDYCLVSLTPEPVVYSLFATAKVLMKDKGLHPNLAPAFIRENAEKALYFLHPRFADEIVNEKPLRAIFAPTITDGPETYFEKASPAEVLRRLAPSTLVQLHVGIDPVQAMRNMAEAVRRLPCYRLCLADDFENIPGIIARKLDERT